MPDPQTVLPGTQKRISDSKEYLVGMLREADYDVVDFGVSQLKQDEEVRPLLDAKPTPKFYEVIEA
jgi:hypothetical protein